MIKYFFLSLFLILSCTTQKQEEISLGLVKQDMGESFNLILTVTNNTSEEQSLEYPEKRGSIEERYSLEEEFVDPII